MSLADTEIDYTLTKGRVLYAHFDIEADGPSPAFNSMLSIGIVFTEASTGKIVHEFLGDFEPLDNHETDQATMTEFWERDENNRKELQRIRDNSRPLFDVMSDLNDTIKAMQAKRVTWVARPSAYDWQWLNYYQNVYLHEGGSGSLTGNPKRQAFKAIDASTMRDIYQDQWGLGRKEMDEVCKEWTSDTGFNMTHNPLDDARYQAVIFHRLLTELSRNKRNQRILDSKCPINYWDWMGNVALLTTGLFIGYKISSIDFQ